MSELAFDRVIVAQDGHTTEMSVEVFRALGLRERVKLLLADAAEFRRGDVVVAAAVALKSMTGGTAR